MKQLTLSILFLSTLATLIQAATPNTNQIETLTLEQALELAERLQPELAEAKALSEAAEGRAKQAGTFPNLDVIARMESARFRDPASQAELPVGISQAIPLGGRLGKAREAEKLERDRRTHELEARRRDLRKRVHSGFATALYQEKAFQTQRDFVADTGKLAATTKARVNAGDALREELARSEMELVRAQVELRRAEALSEHAMVELKAAIGDPGLPVKTLVGSLDAIFEIPTLETLAANLSGHPEVASAVAAVRVRQAQVDLAKAERIPDVRVEALYRRLEASKENAFDIGLMIPLPLFDRNQGRLREARAEVAAAEARSRSTQNALRVRLHDAHAQLTTALANSRALNADVLPRADLVLKATEARFAAGDIGLAELLPVRRDWAAVRLTYLESLRDVMQAWAQVSAYLKPPVRK
ncbi:MAG: TolC family protein [Verrucomicrobia bacterium]|nr:TolC family protein [Verrucomicrobiota bacterium]